MRLTVIGCAGSFPGPRSPASCYLVEHDGTRIVLDMGNGSLGALQAHTDIYGLDGVVLSHLHVDHFIDLASYYVALKYRPDGPARRVPVFGPVGTAQRLAAAYGQGGSDMSGQLDVRTVTDTFQIGSLRITTQVVCHPVEARAIRVSAGGRVLTYSGDTGPHPGLAEFAQGSDVALFEASFLTDAANPADLHLTAAEAAAASASAGADRVVLTHLVPWNSPEATLAEARGVRADAVLAAPGMVVDI